MKYLEKYEAVDKLGSFWYIPYNNKENILMCIKKLPIPEITINFIYDYFIRFLEKNEHRVKYGVYISYGISTTYNKWSFYACEYVSKIETANELYKENGLKFKGEIKLKDWEISSNKYNL